MVWYSHLFKNFPVCCDLHIQGFGIINKAKVNGFFFFFFLKLSCFLNDAMAVGNFISGSSAFSRSSLNIWKFTIQVLLKPSLENFEHYFAGV